MAWAPRSPSSLPVKFPSMRLSLLPGKFGQTPRNLFCCFFVRSKEKLRELQFEIAQENGVALVVEADVTDAAAVQNLLDTTLKAFPKGVDVLVNNAAYVAPIHR